MNSIVLASSLLTTSMFNQALCDDMVLIDINRTRAEGEARDFRHGMPYAASLARIYIGDYFLFC